MKTTFGIIGFLLVIVLAAGCEKATTKAAIQVTPPSSDIAPHESVTLVASIPDTEQEARQLYSPLLWRVSNPSLGSLRQTAGNTAVYVATGAQGVNAVTVQDQAGAEGVAAITQQ